MLRRGLFIIAMGTAACGAQNLPDPTIAFMDFAENRQTQFSKLKSFEMSGTIKIVESKEFLIGRGPKTNELSFHIWAKGDKIKEVVQVVKLEEGEMLQFETSYLDPEKYIWVQQRELNAPRNARIYTREDKVNTGLFNKCPTFSEYSFLRLSVQDAAIPALLPSELGSKEKWNGVSRSLDGASGGKDGSIRITLSPGNGSSTIDLIRVPGAAGGYQIRAVSFFNNRQDLDSMLEVSSYFHDKEFGDIANAFKVSIYRSAPEFPASVVWEYSINEIKLNSPIDDATFNFDPASADRILDVASQTMIK